VDAAHLFIPVFSMTGFSPRIIERTDVAPARTCHNPRLGCLRITATLANPGATKRL
jgi:hypothetical protein